MYFIVLKSLFLILIQSYPFISSLYLMRLTLSQSFSFFLAPVFSSWRPSMPEAMSTAGVSLTLIFTATLYPCYIAVFMCVNLCVWVWNKIVFKWEPRFNKRELCALFSHTILSVKIPRLELSGTLEFINIPSERVIPIFLHKPATARLIYYSTNNKQWMSLLTHILLSNCRC